MILSSKRFYKVGFSHFNFNRGLEHEIETHSAFDLSLIIGPNRSAKYFFFYFLLLLFLLRIVEGKTMISKVKMGSAADEVFYTFLFLLYTIL